MNQNFKTAPDFKNMTGKALVETYNEMAHAALDLGIPGHEPVKRFSTAAAGLARCLKLHALIQAKVAEAGGDAGDASAVNEAVSEVAAKAEATPFAEDVRVDTYDADQRLLGVNIPLWNLAETLKTNVVAIKQGLDQHGLFVKVFEDQTICEAVPAGQPPKRSAALAAATADAASASPAQPADPVQGEAHESEEDMAKKAKKAAGGKKGGKRSTSGNSIREMTEEYNQIVKGLSAAVKKENPWAKHHNSNFESIEKAKKQLARLKKIAG